MVREEPANCLRPVKAIFVRRRSTSTTRTHFTRVSQTHTRIYLVRPPAEAARKFRENNVRRAFAPLAHDIHNFVIPRSHPAAKQRDIRLYCLYTYNVYTPNHHHHHMCVLGAVGMYEEHMSYRDKK